MTASVENGNDTGARPSRLIVVVGTGTEIGKTWASVQLLEAARARGLRVAARKPVQSFEPGGELTDAEQLAAASGERVEDVCPRHRWYPVPMAPPMAAEILGRPTPRLAGIVREIAWQAGTELGLVETVGGLHSPLADDGDSLDLLVRLDPDEVLLVADAGLGTINSVRLAVRALEPFETTVLLNRFDAEDDLHRRNLDWLRTRDGFTVITEITAMLEAA